MITAILVLLCGCPAQPTKTINSDNTDVKIELLATAEVSPGRNIDVYRIWDGSNSSFYMVSESYGGKSAISQSVRQGKTHVDVVYKTLEKNEDKTPSTNEVKDAQKVLIIGKDGKITEINSPSTVNIKNE